MGAGRDRLPPPPSTVADALGPWLFVGVALAYAVQLQFNLVRWRLAALGALLLLGAGAWHRRSALAAWRLHPTVPTLFAASMLVGVATGLLNSEGQAAYAVLRALTPVLLGWGLFLLLPLTPGARRGRGAPRREHRWMVLGLVAATFAVIAAASIPADRLVALDEVLQVLQSRDFTRLEVIRHWEPEFERFFRLPWTAIVPGGFYTQYSPGYPAILAGFTWLGLRTLSGAVLSAVTVAVTYLVGRRVHSGVVGLIAAALLATQMWFVSDGASFFSHMSSMAVTMIAAWLLLRGEEPGTPARAALWWLAGVLLGVAVTIRPLSGIAVAASLWGWMVVRGRLTAPALGAMTGALALGAVLPCLSLLAYNSATTGSPWRLGYQAVHGHLHDLGFGIRGYVMPNADGRSVTVADDFTPLRAMHLFIDAVYDMAVFALPVFSVIPLLAVAGLYRYRFRWGTVAVFLALPVVYFFYHSDDARFSIELLPLLFIGLGAVIVHLWERNASLGRWLLIFLVCGNALMSAVVVWNEHFRTARDGFSGTGFPFRDRVVEAQRKHGKVLVFVRYERKDSRYSSYVFTSLYWFNIDDFPGKIIVARDLGAEDVRLIRRYPDHVPMLLTWPPGRQPMLVRLRPSDAAPVLDARVSGSRDSAPPPRLTRR